ncbi:MAG: N-acetylneuraminate synthase [Promethearchaeota archaeon]
MKTVKMGGKIVGEGAPTFMIAEAGLNHNGKLELAKKLVRKAAEVEADAVKFQTFVTEEFVSKNDKPMYKLFKKLELSFSDFQELSDLSKDVGIMFLSTPLDFKTVNFLEKLDVPAFKIASGDLTNHPFLEYIAKKNKPVILSTGMATLEEVEEAVNLINSTGNNKLVLLHCVSTYPAPFEDANLRAICTLKQAFHVPVGFSDHTLNTLTPVAAVAIGASMIEKHFTLSKKLAGPDHRCSFDVNEFGKMVESIRQVEKMLGSSVKKPVKSEIAILKLARRSLVAKKKIHKGTRITEEMLAFKRPGDGISPTRKNIVIGRTAKVDIGRDELITLDKLN